MTNLMTGAIGEDREAGTAGCPRNSLKMRQFPVFACPEEARMALRGPPESLGIESMKKTHPRRLLDVQSMVARKLTHFPHFLEGLCVLSRG
jgi:hypothetical protein